MTIAVASTVAEVSEAVRGGAPGTRLLPVGAGTKPALSAPAGEDIERLGLHGLSGIVEYDPAELTVTALAGTPVAQLAAVLAEHGQHLPFDPLLAEAGATLGGTVAAGASGPDAWRHGGVRDFVLGVRFVDGTGQLVRSGGRVVKNAAGFDLAKLLVGSIGRLGVIVELSLKVFPHPRASATAEWRLGDGERAVAALSALARGPVELTALELWPGGRLLARLGGREDGLAARAQRLGERLGAAPRLWRGAEEAALWREGREMTWLAAGDTLVRVGLSVRELPALARALATVEGAEVRFGIGGTVAWTRWPAGLERGVLAEILKRLGLPGMALLGPPGRPLLGPATGGAFGARVAAALDPGGRFLPLFTR